MLFTRHYILLFLTGFPAAFGVKAQNADQYVIGGAGGGGVQAGYTIDFTLGETVITTAGTTTVLTQGFLQPPSYKDFPVADLNLRAVIKNNLVQLDWTTSIEVNNDKFFIERSAGGIFFTVIDSLKTKAPNGNSSTPIDYRYIDLQPMPGNNYYRIRQVNKSGLISYSVTVMVTFTAPAWSIHIYPNPVQTYLKIKLYTDGASNATLRLVNTLGQVVLTKKLSFTQGYNDQSLWLEGLKTGMYVLLVSDDKGRKVQLKVLKQ